MNMQIIFQLLNAVPNYLSRQYQVQRWRLQKHQLLAINLVFITLERLAQALALFYCVTVLTQNMSIAEYGKLNYAMSLGGIFMTISLFAGAELIMPKISRYKYLRGQIIATGFYLRLFYAISALLMVLIYGYFKQLSDDIFFVFLAFCFANVVVEVPSILGCWLILQQKNMWFSAARLLGLVTKIYTFYYLSTLKNTENTENTENYKDFYTYFIYPYVFEGLISVVAIVVAFIYFAKKNQVENINNKNIFSGFPWGKFNLKIAKVLVKDGFIIGLSLCAFFVLQRLDRIILEQKTDFSNLGIYANAMILNDAWLNIGLNICSLLAPALIYSIKMNSKKSINKSINNLNKSSEIIENKEVIELKQMLKKCCIYLCIFSAFGIIITQIFAEALVLKYFGTDYKLSVPLLKWAVYLAPLLLINQMYTYCWLHLKRYDLQLFAWFLPCVIIYFLNKIDLQSFAEKSMSLKILKALQVSDMNLHNQQMLISMFVAYICMWAWQHWVLLRMR